ncbi:MAG: PD-(D/E)XK nuclease family protein, partial [Halobacteriaceae archaeon]
RIRYEESIGLRQSKIFANPHGYPYIYDNWHYRFLSKCLKSDYDEERRLMYVAITRAESHVLFSAGSSPSQFFENLPLDPVTIEPEIEDTDIRPTEQTRLQVSIPVPDVPAEQTPHTIMDDSVFSEGEEGKGAEFGEEVHEFAEEYASGTTIEPSNNDENNVKEFIDSLSGEVQTEKAAYLPVNVNDDQVTVSGFIDLLHITDDRVEIIDYKTDRSRYAQSEYRKQLSVYYHVVRQTYPNRQVSTSLFYTENGERVEIDPLSIDELTELVTSSDSKHFEQMSEDARIR